MNRKQLVLMLTALLSLICNGSVNGKSDNKTRVILFGIDAFSTACINNVPNIDWFKENGSWTFKARTIVQTVSGPGWSSILCSLDPVDTGIIDNKWIPEWKGGNPPIHALSGNKPFQCLMDNLQAQNPNLSLKYFYSWPFLSNFYLNAGMVSNKINDSNENYYCDRDVLGYPECDQKVVDKALQNIEDLSFDFMFTYMVNLDKTGHDHGFCDEEYSKEMTRIDGYLGQIVNKLREKGILDSTYIIVTTDHGAESHTTHHGVQDDQNILIPWLVYGPGIKKGYEIQSRVHNMDTSPTICKFFGLSPDESWVGRAVPKIFDTRAQDI